MITRFPRYACLWVSVIALVAVTGHAMAVDEPCFGCHAGVSVQQVADWRASGHASSLDTLKASPNAEDDCLQCHSADYRANPEAVTLDTALYANSCSACHIDHMSEGRFGDAIDKVNHELSKPKNEICSDCHSAAGSEPGQTPPSAQVEIFLGQGGIGVADSPGIHSLMMTDGCVHCHLSDHTFRADIAVCADCHGATADTKFADARNAIQGKLDVVLPLLDTFADKESQDYKDAKFNIDLVQVSNDGGAHNLGYSLALLDHSASILGAEPAPVEESCLGCHRGMHSEIVASWEGSGHATSLTTLKESPDAQDYCLQCHSLDYRNDPENVTLETAMLPNSCGTCHVDHASQGRFGDAVDKENHELSVAKKDMCIDCHTAFDEQSDELLASSQREIFFGVGGAQVADMPGTHSLIMQDGCVACHGSTGHDFHVHDLAGCSDCHADIDTEYGDAKAEIQGLIDEVDALLASADTGTDAYTDAKLNYELVVRSKDLGAHNFKYSKALLEKSVELLSPSEPETPAWDVNADGVVDVLDMVVIGTNFGVEVEGNPDPNPDVNADGIVDVLDLVIIGLHFGESTLEQPAAPALATAPNSQLWLSQSPAQDGLLTVTVHGTFGAPVAGYQFDLLFDSQMLELIGQTQGDLLPGHTSYWREGSRTASGLKSIAATSLGAVTQTVRQSTLATFTFRVRQSALEAVSALRIANSRLADTEALLLPHHVSYTSEVVSLPSATRLMANYPNPFNPETWIPYQLAHSAEVLVEIYNGSGQLVRSIDVGHQPVGYHLSRENAVYWDGLTTTGERAASGIYYYRLTAGEFAQTRRMVIVK